MQPEHKKRDCRNFGEMRDFFRVCCASVTLLSKKIRNPRRKFRPQSYQSGNLHVQPPAWEYQCECYSKEKKRGGRKSAEAPRWISRMRESDHEADHNKIRRRRGELFEESARIHLNSRRCIPRWQGRGLLYSQAENCDSCLRIELLNPKSGKNPILPSFDLSM